MTAALLTLTLFLASGQYAPQQAGSEPLTPVLEARVQTLGKELRCAVCQGLSVADSPSSMARAQLDKIRELVAEGKSDQEVRDYFVARYGEWVLLQPKAEGVNLLVWLGPVALLLGGAFVIFRQVRREPTPAAPAASVPVTPPAASTDSEDPYLAAVRRELDQ
ncbi:cytochrome c-type biogenesis protein CcmH [Archangium gephyra]|uniref:Cytochrome c-type biogenesis protein n=1 Tax=Archangium gephyra TaxID=48 RepID=A0AAC8TG00_9BACT|nr:cytochrome c-type biogenesis protein [Archangium gephyra]AKJ04647.1 Cytochrome c heme lyase subunit CcmL [Archangium gephyra]REG37293.1 cytochrome c-type biogenesis protein CcmH [Archangium gephyra]